MQAIDDQLDRLEDQDNNPCWLHVFESELYDVCYFVLSMLPVARSLLSHTCPFAVCCSEQASANLGS